MIYDCAVVGSGLAGLCAALRLVEGGMRVSVVAKGTGSLHLGGATIDVMGYGPDPITSPRAALALLENDRPDHPYSRAGAEVVAEALTWFTGLSEDMVGDLRENMLLPTPVGAGKPTAVAPRSIASGDLRRGGSMVICGFRALKDLYPTYLAENLAKGAFGTEIDARAVTLDATPEGRVDANGLGFARAFESADFRTELVRQLGSRLNGVERVGFPAVLGLDRADEVRAELSAALEHEVFEIPTLPPSVPGIRLFRTLKRALGRLGCRITMGATVVGATTEAARVNDLHLDIVNRVARMSARHFVLATGGVATGGIGMDSYNRLSEPVVGLPVSFIPRSADHLFDPTYLASHPVGTAGVAVDPEMRAIDRSGEPLYDNLRVVGATVGGAEPWREKSGNGIAVATGFAAAKAILQSEGAWN